jgi:hypothetical protein
MTEPPPLIDTRASFTAALRWGFQAALAEPARRIVCCDALFADWPLDEPALLQALTRWLRLPQRQLVLLARSYEELPRRCPRFDAWRVDWSHAIEAWVAPDEMASDLPSVLVSGGSISVQLIDRMHWRGRAAVDARSAGQWRQELDVVLQRSERGYPPKALGL